MLIYHFQHRFPCYLCIYFSQALYVFKKDLNVERRRLTRWCWRKHPMGRKVAELQRQQTSRTLHLARVERST